MRDDDASSGLFGWPLVSRECAVTAESGLPAGGLCAFSVPVEFGNPIRKGTARAPEAIRRQSRRPGNVGVGVGVDAGELPRELALDPAGCVAALKSRVADMRAAGLYPMMIGGDHALSYGPVSALADAGDLCVVWFDAHTDFSEWRPPATHDHKQVLRRIATLPGVRRIVQVGYRGITTGDERDLGERAVVLTTAAARRLDAHAFLALVPESLPCYVSIDIDVIDPLLAPGTGAPVPDGLLPEQVRDWLIALLRHRRVVGLDLVECNPALDQAGDTIRIAVDLLAVAARHWPGTRVPAPGDPAPDVSQVVENAST